MSVVLGLGMYKISSDIMWYESSQKKEPLMKEDKSLTLPNDSSHIHTAPLLMVCYKF